MEFYQYKEDDTVKLEVEKLTDPRKDSYTTWLWIAKSQEMFKKQASSSQNLS